MTEAANYLLQLILQQYMRDISILYLFYYIANDDIYEVQVFTISIYYDVNITSRYYISSLLFSWVFFTLEPSEWIDRKSHHQTPIKLSD